MGMKIVKGEGAILRVNVGHPIVTDGDFVASLFSTIRGGDEAFPKLIWDLMLYLYLLFYYQFQ